MEKRQRQTGVEWRPARSIASKGSSDSSNKQFPDEAPLIGREREIQAACTLLRRPDVRLLMITGVGGIGKTCLALQVTESMRQDFPDGIYFIPLSAIRDSALLVSAIVEGLGLRGATFLFENLVDFLRRGRYLLVLDNFEQLVDAGPMLVAIELAAARLKILSPQGLLTRLEHRLEVLTSGEDDLPVRQQTLRNTLIWSYNLLNVNERWLFRYMAAFSGGCNMEAIEALCIALGGTLPVLDSVTSLLDNNLLYRRDLEDEPHMYMLETIREYGLELLAARGEREQVMSACAAYYRKYTEQAEVSLRGREQAFWLRRLEQEYNNIRATLSWLLEQNELEATLDLAATLGGFWFLSKYINEGRHFLAQALALSDEHGTAVSLPVKAKALYISGRLALWQHDIQQAVSFLEESSHLFRSLGIRPLLVSSLSLLSSAENHRSQFAVADETVALLRTLRNPGFTAEALMVLAYELIALNEETSASVLLEEALALAQEVGGKSGIAQVLCAMGYLALQQGQSAWAVQLFGAAEALRAMHGYRNSVGTDRAFLERCLAAVCDKLGEEAFDALWKNGQTLSPQDALAAEGRTSVSVPLPETPSATTKLPFSLASPDILTRREIEVLRLVAEGLTNAQITKRLVISASTVNTHVQSIYTKLGIASRSAATRYAIEHYLI